MNEQEKAEKVNIVIMTVALVLTLYAIYKALFWAFFSGDHIIVRMIAAGVWSVIAYGIPTFTLQIVNGINKGAKSSTGHGET